MAMKRTDNQNNQKGQVATKVAMVLIPIGVIHHFHTCLLNKDKKI